MDGPRGVRVLCVDDNPDVAQLLVTFFNLSGCEARECLDGPAALAAAEEFRPHACVLDVNMPGMDGCELARRLRARLGVVVRLIALSGADGDEHVERVTAAGFDFSVTKPPDLNHLLALAVEAGSLVEPG
jgi:two-component system OmpR family response regulator